MEPLLFVSLTGEVPGETGEAEVMTGVFGVTWESPEARTPPGDLLESSCFVSLAGKAAGETGVIGVIDRVLNVIWGTSGLGLGAAGVERGSGWVWAWLLDAWLAVRSVRAACVKVKKG